MTYSSLLFIYLFFPVSLLLYTVTPNKLKDWILYGESLIFCCFMGFRSAAFIIIYCLVNYLAGLSIYDIPPKYKSIPLAVGILFDVIMLISFRSSYFAYLHSFTGIAQNIFPVGISIFTLSAIGYLADIYRGNSKCDKNFIRFSLYLMMFPRLIMGTIVSYDTFVYTLRNRRYNIAEIGSGLIGFTKGLAKKLFILCFVAMGHIIDAYIIGSSSVFMTAVILFYTANEGISLLENASVLGLPVPEKLKEVLLQIKRKEEERNERS